MNFALNSPDTTAPAASVTAATVNNTSDVTSVQSTETGTAYLVKQGSVVTSKASLDTLASGNDANSATVTTASSNTTLSTSGLTDGTYYVYAVDAAGNVSAASTNAVTLDSTSPTLSSSTPADNATGLAPTASLEIVFDGNVAFGSSGSITLKNVSTGATVQTWDVSNASHKGSSNGQVNISGTTLTINPGSNLDEATQYAVQISATAVKDSANNAFAGIADTITLNFTTSVTDSAAPALLAIQRTAAEATNAATLTYTLVFNEAVTNVDASDFAVSTTGTATGSVTSVTGSGNTRTVTVDTVTGTGKLGLSLNTGHGITDIAGNALPDGNPADNEAYIVDRTLPTLLSLNRLTAGDGTTNADSVQFLALFSEPVSGLAAGDFALTGTATTGASITSVSGNGSSVITITVDSVGGDGSLGVALAASPTITDAIGNGLTNISPTSTIAESYTIDNSAPTAVSILRSAAELTSDGSVTFDVVFNESVQNLSVDDFALTGTATGTIASVTGSGSAYTVTVSSVAGDGALGLSYAGAQNISDAGGNVFAGALPLRDESSTVDNTAPVVTAISRAGVNQIAASTATNAVFTVLFSEAVTGVAADDFAVTGTASHGAVSVSSADGKVFQVTVADVNGTVGQTLGLSFTGSVNDALSQTGNAQFITGQTYTIGGVLLNEGAIDQAGLDALAGANHNGMLHLVDAVGTASEVVILDSRLPGMATLMNGVSSSTDVWLLDAGSSALGQISALLGQYHNLSAVHLLSHGSSGEIYLGAETISASTLASQSATLSEWGNALSDTGDLLVYGCNVGAGETGQHFIDALAVATRADVAASDDLTGSSWLGGDWVLEAKAGVVDAASVLSVVDYTGIFIPPVSSGVTITRTGGATAVVEGGATDTYTVVLASAPTADVVIMLDDTNGQVSFDSPTLTFTSANWSTAQTVTVTAVNDTVGEGAHTGVIHHRASSADANYSNISIANLVVAVGDNDLPVGDRAFQTAQTNPFGLSDVGSIAKPTFVDIDGDGDLDAFVGNKDGNTLFFLNTGSASSAAFSAASSNPFGLSDVGLSASPTFVDIDGDGDLDAFVGNKDGNTLFFLNTGNASSAAFSAAATNPFGLSDAGSFASPTLVDIDGDGDLDVFVGNNLTADNMLFFLNTGRASSAVFSAAVSNPFGLINVVKYAAPTFADIDGDGDLDAFVGEWYGDTQFFRNTGSAGSAAFASAVLNPFGLSGVGKYAVAPTFVDIDGDGDLDAFVGNKDGNTLFFLNVPANAAPAFTGDTTPADGTHDTGLTVNENATATDIASLLAVTDTDSGQTLTWSVVSGQGPSHGTQGGFTTSPTAASGTGVTPYSVTYTPTSNYIGTDSFQIQVSDGTVTDTVTVTVTVTDVNPSISNATFSVDENSSTSSAVGTVTATGDTNGLTYSITGGNTGNVFAINSTTGAITVAGALNYEVTSSYSLTVAVDDEDPDTIADSTATITVNINNLVDSPVVLSVTPLDNSTAVAVTSNVILTFDQDVQLGSSGTITLYDITGVGTNSIAIDVTSHAGQPFDNRQNADHQPDSQPDYHQPVCRAVHRWRIEGYNRSGMCSNQRHHNTQLHHRHHRYHSADRHHR